MRDLDLASKRAVGWPEALIPRLRLFVAIALAMGLWPPPISANERFDGVVSVIPEWPGRPPNMAEPEGSGVVVLDGRHVVTALHVIGDAEHVDIRPADGRRIPARVVGVAPGVDLALLRFEGQLPVLDQGDPPAVGAQVCVVGNGFGLGLSLTCGVVSAVRRTGVGFNPIEDFIQTDAAVNPGHSGGALLDGNGMLVGIVSAIFTKESDANVGVNFAVSLQLMDRVISELADRGRVKWVDPGVRAVAVRSLISHSTPYGPAVGVRVTQIDRKGPLALAGVLSGDLLLAAGGRLMRGPTDLTAAVALHRPGDVMQLWLVRGDREPERIPVQF